MQTQHQKTPPTRNTEPPPLYMLILPDAHMIQAPTFDVAMDEVRKVPANTKCYMYKLERIY